MSAVGLTVIEVEIETKCSQDELEKYTIFNPCVICQKHGKLLQPQNS